MRSHEIIIEKKKLKKRDHSEDEWVLIKAERQARHVMGEMIARTIGDARKIMQEKGYEINFQYSSSMAKRMAPGMLLINKDREKILKQITGALSGTVASHPEYGSIEEYKDEFVDMLLQLIANEFENYKRTIEEL